MFREMRRKQQQLSKEDCIAVLKKATSGVLAVSGDEDYPYAVPINYVYDEGKLFFHCAKSGHKLDAIQQNHHVSFCVIDQDIIVPMEYTSYFRSVIVFGKMRILENDLEKRYAIETLAARFTPEVSAEERNQAIEQSYSALCMLELSIEHLSGKEAKELVKIRMDHTK